MSLGSRAGTRFEQKSNGPGQPARTEIGHYQLGFKIGKGYFGTVFTGLDQQTGTEVAIKQLDVKKMRKANLHSYMQEIELMKGLTHQNIVRYIDFIKTKDTYNLIMEYVESGSLLDLIKKYGVVPETLASIYISQVLEGLAYLQEQKIVHRDIKCSNILITKQGCCKLADFGMAGRADSQNTKFTVQGSPYWMAPEIIQMEGAGFPSDIWSVGCSCIELLTSKPPYFDLQPMQALFKVVNSEECMIPEGFSDDANDFLGKCLIKDPENRGVAADLLQHVWLTSGRSVDRKMTITEMVKDFDDTKTNRRKQKGGSERKKAQMRLTIDITTTEEQDKMELEKLSDHSNHEAVLQHLVNYKNALDKAHSVQQEGDLAGEVKRLKEENMQLILMFQKQLGKCLAEKKKAIGLAYRYDEKMQEAQREVREGSKALSHTERMLRRTNQFAAEAQRSASASRRLTESLQRYFVSRYDRRQAPKKFALALYGELSANRLSKPPCYKDTPMWRWSSSWHDVPVLILRDVFLFAFSSLKDRTPSQMWMLRERVAVAVITDEIKGRGHAFQLTTGVDGEVVVVLAAKSKDARHKWINAIKTTTSHGIKYTEMPAIAAPSKKRTSV